MKPLALTILCVASIALAKNNFIDGQVFIVTGAHESVKLGLVTVAACRPDEFASTVASTKSQIESERPKLDAMRPVVKQMAAVASELHSTVMKTDTRTYVTSDAFSTLLGDCIHMETNTETLAHRVAWRADYLNSGAPYFKNLPHPIASVKTDADGKFKMELPSSIGQVIIAASATRYVPTGEQETYFWAVKVTPPATITLSNDNLTNAGSNDSALQTLALVTSWPEILSDALKGAPNEEYTADTLKAELQKLEADAEKLKRDFQVSTGTATELPAAAPAPAFMITLTQPVSIQTESGTVTLPVGTQVQFVSQLNNKVHVHYLNRDHLIPISATNLNRKPSKTAK